MSEYDHLIDTICCTSASVDSRSAAERRLLELLSVPNNLARCLPSLYTANDTAVFFLGIGLQRLIWRYWSMLDQTQRDSLLETVKATLLNRNDLQTFSKAKLEQVLAAICVCSSSLQPAFSTIVQTDHPAFLTGLSAVKTVLENVLGDDPKIDEDARLAFVAETEVILSPLTNLACTACVSALQSNTSQSAQALTIGLDLLKVIVGKMQIGVHISLDVLDLLFSIAEQGAASVSEGVVSQESALSAMEILTEIMYKRYIPTGASPEDTNINSLSMKQDQGVKVLMRLVAKSIDLLKRYSEVADGLVASAMVLSLLEFVAVFGECHMERCMQYSFSHLHVTSMYTDIALLRETIMSFFSELINLTVLTNDPQLLQKIVSVWRRLLYITHVKDTILSQQTVCVSVVSHLLSASLIATNPHLRENMEEMLDYVTVNVHADTHLRDMMRKISPLLTQHPSKFDQQNSKNANNNCTSNDNRLSSVEEHNYVGCALVEDVQELIPEFLDSKFACQWLYVHLPTLITANMQSVLSQAVLSPAYTQATLDLKLLFRMVPLIAINMDPILQMFQFLVQVIDRHTETGVLAKECILLLMTGAQMLGQFFQGHKFARELEGIIANITNTNGDNNSNNNSSGSNSSLSEWSNHLDTILGCVSHMLQTFFGGMYSSLRVSDDMQSLLTSLVILFYHVTNATTPLLDLPVFAPYKQSVLETLTFFLSPASLPQIQVQCPFLFEDMFALFAIMKDSLLPGSMSQVCVAQVHDATQLLENLVVTHQQQQQQQSLKANNNLSVNSSDNVHISNSNNSNHINSTVVAHLLEEPTLSALHLLLVSVYVLIQNQHVLKTTRKQLIIAELTNLNAVITRLVHSLLYLQQYVWLDFLRAKYHVIIEDTRFDNSKKNDSDLLRSHNISQEGVAILVSNNGSSSSSVDIAFIGMKMDLIARLLRLSIGIMCVLLQRIGKKSFGKHASDVLDLCVSFVESCTSLTPPPCGSDNNAFNAASFHAKRDSYPHLQAMLSINPHNILCVALFDSRVSATLLLRHTTTKNNSANVSGCGGVKLLQEIFELCQAVAQSTSASSASVATQSHATHHLLQSMLPYLSDEKTCGELLPGILQTGIVAVNAYWQRAPRTINNSVVNAGANISFLSSIATHNATNNNNNNINAMILNKNSNSSNHNSDNLVNNSGENVKELTSVLVTLCTGSLGDTVAPADTLIAIEGLLLLKEQHNVFIAQWFQQTLWSNLFVCVLRCLVLRIHAMHGQELEKLFVHLVETRVQYLTSFAENRNVNNNDNSANNNGSATVTVQEFWFNLGNEVVTLASELHCGNAAHEFLSPIINDFLQSNDAYKLVQHASPIGQVVLHRIVRPVVAVIFRRI